MLIIGISGGSGSGKTAFAQRLQENLGENCCILNQDHYYKPLAELPSPLNFDSPEAIDFELLYEHLALLKKGVDIEQPVYDFISSERVSQKRVFPRDVVILEGFLVFFVDKIREMLDLKIYLDVGEDVQFIRQMERDISERDRSYERVRDDYVQHVRPAYQKYVLPSRRYADLIIPNEELNGKCLDILVQYLRWSIPK